MTDREIAKLVPLDWYGIVQTETEECTNIVKVLGAGVEHEGVCGLMKKFFANGWERLTMIRRVKGGQRFVSWVIDEKTEVPAAEDIVEVNPETKKERDEDWRRERAQEAGMLHGIDAYNEVMEERG